MQDGAVNATNQESPPASDQAPVTPAQTQQPPQAQQTQAAPKEQGQSAEEQIAYWKGVAQANRQKAEAYDEYEVLIDHMNTHPKDVESIERIITGQAQDIITAQGMTQEANTGSMTDDQRFEMELGLGAPQQAQAQPQAQQPSNGMSAEDARKLGAMQERARIELAAFKDDLLQNGIGDHMIDQFLQFLKEPSGLSYHDLFAAWKSNQARIAPAQNAGTPSGAQPATGVMPPTVGSIPGAESNRPDAGNYRAVGNGDKYVADPSNI